MARARRRPLLEESADRTLIATTAKLTPTASAVLVLRATWTTPPTCDVIAKLEPTDNGKFLQYDGTELPW